DDRRCDPIYRGLFPSPLRAFRGGAQRVQGSCHSSVLGGRIAGVHHPGRQPLGRVGVEREGIHT
ncbi:MAG TPA: hypothetical protein VKH36_10400, partial [Acidimicrobiia bacterium]|nr:hypothetical protein [Acidimicrobiia bacterium]